MKFKCEKRTLAKVVRRAHKIGAIINVMADQTGNRVAITTCDIHSMVTQYIAADVAAPGTYTVSANALKKALTGQAKAGDEIVVTVGTPYRGTEALVIDEGVERLAAIEGNRKAPTIDRPGRFTGTVLVWRTAKRRDCQNGMGDPHRIQPSVPQRRFHGTDRTG